MGDNKEINCPKDVGLGLPASNSQLLDLEENKIMKNTMIGLDTIDEPELISEEEVEKANDEEEQDYKGTNKIEDIPCQYFSVDQGSNQKKPKDRRIIPNGKQRSSFLFKKSKEIEAVLNSEPLDLEKLRQLAKEDGGLVKDDLRRRAWPCLMQVDSFNSITKASYNDIEEHKDYKQVVMDVNRTLKRFPPGIDEDYRYVLMNQLTTLIIRVLNKHPHLHYYQGFHDVAITFLLVVGESLGFELVEKLSVTHLQEFMRPSMEKTTYYLTYLYPVLKRTNKPLYDFLIKSGVGTIFCLPWLITWYAHTLSDYRNVVRLYDFFLATPYLMPMYIAVAIVLYREKDILSQECDMAMQHFILSQVPDTLPFEDILRKASELYTLYPPDDMQEDVEVMIKEKAKEEEEEKRRRLILRKKKMGGQSPALSFLASISAKLRLSQRQRTFVKIFAFALSATIATGLYGYYTNTPLLRAYIPWS